MVPSTDSSLELETLIQTSVLLEPERKSALLGSLDLLTAKEAKEFAATLRRAEKAFLESATRDPGTRPELEKVLSKNERAVRSARENDERSVEQKKMNALFPDAA